jgi:hypothetical protein
MFCNFNFLISEVQKNRYWMVNLRAAHVLADFLKLQRNNGHDGEPHRHIVGGDP